MSNWETIRGICLHKADIKTFITKEDPFTLKTRQEEVLKYENIQCLYCSNDSSSMKQTESNNFLDIKGYIIFDPTINLKNGDTVIVKIGGGIENQTYQAHDVWYYPNSHKEADLVLEVNL